MILFFFSSTCLVDVFRLFAFVVDDVELAVDGAAKSFSLLLVARPWLLDRPNRLSFHGATLVVNALHHIFS